MEGFNRKPGFGNRSGGFRRGGNRFGGRRFNDRPREMHKAVCSECQKECEVPFKPTEGKPIYCKECYFKRKDSERGEGARPGRKEEQENEEEEF